LTETRLLIRGEQVGGDGERLEVTELAWLYNLNRGIFATTGREEEWTISVSHPEEAADAYIAVFEELARDLTS
jgi:glutamate-1-semialdehyde 2,1-aminomutase